VKGGNSLFALVLLGLEGSWCASLVVFVALTSFYGVFLLLHCCFERRRWLGSNFILVSKALTYLTRASSLIGEREIG
jgi:hypothetical protein